jgi:hypothetical protein
VVHSARVAKVDLGSVAERLFMGFLAPLVLGGELLPGRPIGGHAALALGQERVITDGEKLSHVQLVRTRIARKLAPIDRLEGPTVWEWALGAALHDLVQATHPSLRGAFRRRTPDRILNFADATVERVPPPATIGEALSRHTWFSRWLEIARTDTVVSWWVGSRSFLGTTPPSRLMAWPELRRVNVEKAARPLMDLPASGGAVDADAFAQSIGRFLARTPLTDVATCHRTAPVFQWTAESLGLVATRPGRTLVGRALGFVPSNLVDGALGQSTRRLVLARAWQSAGIALDLLGERALAQAIAADPRSDPPPFSKDPRDDAAYARVAGALVGRQFIATHGEVFAEDERRRLLARLEPAATSALARQLETALSGAAAEVG